MGTHQAAKLAAFCPQTAYPDSSIWELGLWAEKAFEDSISVNRMGPRSLSFKSLRSSIQLFKAENAVKCLSKEFQSYC